MGKKKYTTTGSGPNHISLDDFLNGGAPEVVVENKELASVKPIEEALQEKKDAVKQKALYDFEVNDAIKEIKTDASDKKESATQTKKATAQSGYFKSATKSKGNVGTIENQERKNMSDLSGLFEAAETNSDNNDIPVFEELKSSGKKKDTTKEKELTEQAKAFIEQEKRKEEKRVAQEETKVRQTAQMQAKFEQEQAKLKAKQEAEKAKQKAKQEKIEAEEKVKQEKKDAKQAKKDAKAEAKRLKAEEKARKKKETDERIAKKKKLKKGVSLNGEKEYSDTVKKYLVRDAEAKGVVNKIKQFETDYTPGKFIAEILLIMLGVAMVCYIFHLDWKYIAVCCAMSACVCPFILLAWFRQAYATKRFRMVVDYLSNIIPIFMQKPKIRYALQEVLPITTGKMRRTVASAINYMDNNYVDIDMNKNALSIIEDVFPNSRIKMVHDMMITIEGGNSTNFQKIANNTYVDVENWIRRVYRFQADIKKRRNSLFIMCGLSLMVSWIFTMVYTASEYFEGFTDSPVYQISTMLFIFAELIVVAVLLTKLNGNWLVNDSNAKDEERLEVAYDYVQLGKPTIKLPNIIFAVIMLAVAAYVWKGMGSVLLAGICVFFSYFVLISERTKYSSRLRSLRKHFTIEYPAFLRDVSLRMNNLTVVNSIKELTKTCSYPLQQELFDFLEGVRDNPTSISPYASFMEEYNIPDIQSSMQTLYAIQNIGQGSAEAQMASLVLRNEEMLDKAEELKNADSLQGVELIGYVPMVLLTLHMMVAMALMFMNILSYFDGLALF